MKFYCCFCIYSPGADRKEAITIIDGLAVCDDHTNAASTKDGNFLDKLSKLLDAPVEG